MREQDLAKLSQTPQRRVAKALRVSATDLANVRKRQERPDDWHLSQEGHHDGEDWGDQLKERRGDSAQSPNRFKKPGWVSSAKQTGSCAITSSRSKCRFTATQRTECLDDQAPERKLPDVSPAVERADGP